MRLSTAAPRPIAFSRGGRTSARAVIVFLGLPECPPNRLCGSDGDCISSVVVCGERGVGGYFWRRVRYVGSIPPKGDTEKPSDRPGACGEVLSQPFRLERGRARG
eukprot:scaffold29014_cov118-Isochrysis_galbana.AAC.6